jgi:hypothetical protein
MIFLDDIQKTVNTAYLALAELQYMISVKEPVSGDVVFFDKMYTLSTKLVANLEYINLLSLGVDFKENQEMESIIYSLREIISKIKSTWP